MEWQAFLTFFGILLIYSEGSDNGLIQPISVDILTKNITLRDTDNLLDNNRNTHALIHSDVNHEVLILLKLAREYQVTSIEIISDTPSELKQSIQIGYMQGELDAKTSVQYECTINKTSTICRAPCKSSSESENAGVVGQSVLWKVQRNSQTGWTRIYDLVINGRSFEDLSLFYGRKGDLTFLKPYTIDNPPDEPCAYPFWRLTDASRANSDLAPITSHNQNVTLHFGRTSLVNRVSFVISNSDTSITEKTLHFGGPQSETYLIKLNEHCTVNSEDKHVYICETNELSGYPFTDVTVDIKGLVRINIFGMPLIYPRLDIVATPKNADSESIYNLKLKCVAVLCSPNILMKLTTKVHGKPVDSCARQGHNVQCANMELLRVQAGTDDQTTKSETLLISDGKLVNSVEETMTELKVLAFSSTELLVSMPRTHPYYGQYKCQCQADDKVASLIESGPTSLESTEFDRGDLVFQRNYSAILDEKHINSVLGFLELPDDPQLGYFRLAIAGYSLTEKLHLTATFLESGQNASVTGDYAEFTSVLAFPRAKDAKYAWPIPAYRVELQEAYPDPVDDGVIVIDWSTTEDAVSVKQVKDMIKTIVPSTANEGSARGWIWTRDSHELDIRAYYQMGNNGAGPVEIYLQRTGCSSNGTNEKVGSVRIADQQCEIGSGSVIPLCEKAETGFAVQFVIRQPSASDSYELFSHVGNDSADKQLAYSAAIAQDLEGELDATEISLKIASLGPEGESESTPMDLVVLVHSKTIVDNSACRRIMLTLHPTWPVNELLVKQLSANETTFHVTVPNDQRVITLELEIQIESEEATKFSTRRSVTIPNPRFYTLELKADDSTGMIEWSSLPLPFRGILDHFQVKLFRTDHVCGMREEVQPPPTREELNDSPVYRIHLSDMPGFDSDVKVQYEAEITPILKTQNPEHTLPGAVAIAGVARGSIGSSLIQQYVSLSGRTARFYILPSQLANCLQDNNAMTVSFELKVIGEDQSTPSYINDVIFEVDQSERKGDLGRWYVAKNLQPGRRYEIKATVLYPTGQQDNPSSFIQFWTPDELSVTNKEAFVSPGDSVTFNCTGAVGPDNQYRKRLEWKRGDGTPLPDGSSVENSEVGLDWTQTSSLIFNKVETGQSSTYACFIRPSVSEMMGKSFEPKTVKLSVTDLALDKQVEIVESGDSITVVCSSKSTAQLEWISPDDQNVPTTVSEENPYAVPGTGDINELRLHIPSASLSNTGEYHCKQTGSKSSQNFRLRLREGVQLETTPESSRKATEKFTLICTARLGHRDQHIVWYRRPSETSPWIPLKDTIEQFPSVEIKNEEGEDNVRYSKFTWINSPSSRGQFACALQDQIVEHAGENKLVQLIMHLPEASATYETSSDPIVQMESKKSSTSDEVKLKCIGHPVSDTDRLNWFYLPHGQSQAIPVEPELQTPSTADPNLIKQMQQSFRLGEYSPATWPGSSGPVLLAATGNFKTRKIRSAYSTPEILELIVSGPLEGDLKSGTLLCHYRSPKTVLLVENDLPIGQDRSKDSGPFIETRIEMSEVMDIIADKRPRTLAHKSGIIVEGTQSDSRSKTTCLKFTWPALFLIVCLFLQLAHI